MWRSSLFGLLLTASAVAAHGGEDVADDSVTGGPGRGGSHCLNDSGSAVVLHQLVGAQYNPRGVEHSFRLGVCFPLVGYPHVLFDYTHVELGFVNYLSPVYSQVGGYFQVVPLSLLVFRVELSWLGYWPFFVDRAGYFGRSSPDDDYRNRALPAEAASTATGWNMNIVGVLRGRIPLGPVGLVFLDIVNYEYWRLGSEPYYVNLRRDMIVPRSAWILANEAVVALEVPLSGTLNLRVGGFDAFRCVPATEHRAHLAGGIVMLHWPKARRARDLSPFVRVGVYSHHPFRRGTVAVLAGVTTSYELTRW